MLIYGRIFSCTYIKRLTSFTRNNVKHMRRQISYKASTGCTSMAKFNNQITLYKPNAFMIFDIVYMPRLPQSGKIECWFGWHKKWEWSMPYVYVLCDDGPLYIILLYHVQKACLPHAVLMLICLPPVCTHKYKFDFTLT